MIEESTIVEINGKKYKFYKEYENSGPSYHEVEFHKHKYAGGTEEWEAWDEVDDTSVLCGKCKGDLFKVSACNNNYETWAYCSCGNKLLLHTG